MPQEILQGVDTLLAKLTCKVMEKKYKKVEQGEEEEEEEDAVCRVGDRQDGGVCVCRRREGGREGWRQGGRKAAISAQKINNSTPRCVCSTLNA